MEVEDHNAALHRTEPDLYYLMPMPGVRTATFGDKEYTVGFCVNSPGAGGYCDDKCLWISDKLTDPADIVMVTIHECLHAIFPDLKEVEVGRAADQMSKFLLDVFRVKGTAPLPKLRRLCTPKLKAKLFPELVKPKPRKGAGGSTSASQGVLPGMNPELPAPAVGSEGAA